ncbi:MAG: DUF3352 domain-containing protein [Candidatus Omnitrophica bacterium]|nr:DUF3352 domain-containing protein [Candidatus Omnitrophota bacterium]
MKRPVIIVLIGIVVAAGIFFAVQTFIKPGKIGDIESLVPSEAIYYIYSYQLGQKIEDFCNSDFFLKISNLSFYQEYLQPSIDKKEKLYKNLSQVYNSDSALAVFSPGIVAPSGGIEPMIEPGKFMLLVRMDTKKNIKKTIGDLYLLLNEKEDVSYSTYKGIKITHYQIPLDKSKFPFPDLKISYAVLGDILVSSNTDELLKQSIDLFNKSSTDSLLNDEVYKKISGKYADKKKDSFFWTFINYKRYTEKFLAQVDDMFIDQAQNEKMRDFIESFIDVSAGIISYLGYDSSKSGFVGESYQLYDKSKDDHGLLEISSSKGSKNDLTAVIPPQFFVYFGCSGNISGYWNYFSKLMMSSEEIKQSAMGDSMYAADKQPSFSKTIKSLETYLGLSIEKDVMPLLGNDFSFVISDLEEVSLAPKSGQINPMQLFPTPMPTLSLLFETKDQSSAEKLKSLIIEKVTQLSPSQPESEPFLSIAEDSYAGVNLSVISIKELPFHPVCFVLNDKCIISSTTDHAKKIIDTSKQSSNSLENNLDFSFDPNKILKGSAATLIVKFADLIDAIAQTKIVNFAKPSVALFSQGKVTTNDIDDIIDILDDISIIAQANDITADGTGSGLFYIGIEGL